MNGFNIDSNLVPVTLDELVSLDRIIYLCHSFEQRDCKKRLNDKGENITFYVEKSINDNLPLKMQLYNNRSFALIPNQPVGALVYELDYFNPNGFRPGKCAELPGGIEFENVGYVLANPSNTYFSENESGWKNKKQGIPLESKVNINFTKIGDINKAIYFIKYSI